MAVIARTQHEIKVLISPHLYEAVIFDLDGVVTRTASLHAAAWKALFDAYLLERSKQDGKDYEPFDIQYDYLEYVDGKPRYDGVQSFLLSRGIKLPYGEPEDPPEAETICGLGNRKNQYFQSLLEERGVEIYESTVNLIHQLRRENIKTAIISASKNCAKILEEAGLTDLFDARVDGMEAVRLGLQGKPAPDVFLEAARQVGADPRRSAVVEDALAGVHAGKAGDFKLVIGVDRGNQADRLRASGANVVVQDLAEVAVGESGLFEAVESGKAEMDFTGETADHWRLVYNRYDPRKEGIRESLCALGNGYFVTRGAAPESQQNRIHYPGTYLAGTYNRLSTEIAGKIIEHDDLVNLPNWLSLTFRIDQGSWFSLKAVEILDFRQELNLREGILYRQIRFKDAHERVTQLEERRLVHMRHYHLAALETRLTAENWTGQLEIRTALDGRVVNDNVKRYWYLDKRHLEPLESTVRDDGSLFLKMQTNQSGIRVAQASRTVLRWPDKRPIRHRSRNIVDDDYVAQDLTLSLSQGDTVIVEKTMAMYSSQDVAISECGQAAQEAILNAPEFTSLFDTQIETWKHLWQLFDIDIDTEPEETPTTAMILHLHIFHLLQTVSQNSIDRDVGIPARGWHGEGYRGHIFWDDLFVFPFLNLRRPEIAEALLKYRYRRLDQARMLARQEGLQGALFPWQSSSNGREETPRLHYKFDQNRWIPDNTCFQKHVNAAIVHNIWQYYEVTGDIECLNSYGAEIILEIARLFASLSTYNPELDRYEIKGVMGPDEYHDGYPGERGSGINNNAYTNLMAVWVMCVALKILEAMPADRRQILSEKLDITPDELALWNDISRKMKLFVQPDGIISQFEGYENLSEFPRDRSVQEILEQTGGTLNAYKMSKQADVLMLFYLFSAEELEDLFTRLGYPFDPAWIPKNIDYYLSRTAHGSTLSRIAHAWVLSRADRRRSWQLFRKALQSDVSDTQGGTTPEGIHMGAMAGTVDIVQRCYTGLVTRDDVLWLNPCLPDNLRHMGMCLHYRRQSLRVELTHQELTVAARYSAAKPIKIGFQGEIYELHAGQQKTFRLANGGCLSKQSAIPATE